MWHIYVIKSKEGKIYIGMSQDIQKRIQNHNSQKNYTTKRGSNWKLVYFEKCDSPNHAREREKYFKNTSGKEWLKRRNII